MSQIPTQATVGQVFTPGSGLAHGALLQDPAEVVNDSLITLFCSTNQSVVFRLNQFARATHAIARSPWHTIKDGVIELTIALLHRALQDAAHNSVFLASKTTGKMTLLLLIHMELVAIDKVASNVIQEDEDEDADHPAAESILDTLAALYPDFDVLADMLTEGLTARPAGVEEDAYALYCDTRKDIGLVCHDAD